MWHGWCSQGCKKAIASIFATRQAAGLLGQFLPLAGLNHFTILLEMARADGALALACQQLSLL
jgi:hypothetical protein